MSILRRVACAGAAAILSPMIAAAPARAAHPGASGLIAFYQAPRWTTSSNGRRFFVKAEPTCFSSGAA